MKNSLETLSIRELRDGLASRKFRVDEIVEAYLSRIEQRDSDIGAFLHLDAAAARQSAAMLDQRLAEGQALPRLAGTVIAVKDNICIQGMPATAGSKILEEYRPPYSATAVERLRQAGAIVVGKTNLDEFAMGSSTESSAFRTTRNPRAHDRVPGGSSGGSAAAVADQMVTAALGSDTGGSVRQPAAFTGVVGFRPTYGSVSRYGLMAMASSMDVIGPLARSVADAREIFSAMGGYDPKDATTLPDAQLKSESQPINWSGLKVGVPTEYLEGDLQPAVRTAVDRAIAAVKQAGATVVNVSLPSTDYVVSTYYVLVPAEASSNLARYDGIRFGPGIAEDHGHARATAALRGQRFGPEPRRRSLLGAFVLSAGYADRYYHQAQRVRTLVRQDFATVFDQVNILLTPTTPSEAFPIGAVVDPVSMYMQDVFTIGASLAGIPAISLPAPVAGLPIGIQLIGKQGDDAALLDAAEGLETLLAQSV